MNRTGTVALARSSRSQRGVALLTVLLVVAIITVLASSMVGRMEYHVLRSQNIKHNEQAYWLVRSAESYAISAISTLIREEDGVISLDQAWNEPFSFPVQGGLIEAEVTDATACFNLNSVIGGQPPQDQRPTAINKQISAELAAFRRLILLAIPALDSFTADTIRDSLADWIDDDDVFRDYGAESSEYEGLIPAYRTADQPLAWLSELRLLKGMTPAILERLLPLVCVIPNNPNLRININTLDEDSAVLLAALVGLSRSEAESILQQRPSDGFDDTESLFSDPLMQNANLSTQQKQWFKVDSEYFTIKTQATFGNATFFQTSILNIDANGGTVIGREIGQRY